MFYKPSEGHGLPHNPFNAIVAPRPIGWISTRGTLGDNLAPYSFFNAVAYVPPQVMFASTTTKPDRDNTKDTVAQIRESGVFCVNMVTEALIDGGSLEPCELLDFLSSWLALHIRHTDQLLMQFVLQGPQGNSPK